MCRIQLELDTLQTGSPERASCLGTAPSSHVPSDHSSFEFALLILSVEQP